MLPVGCRGTNFYICKVIYGFEYYRPAPTCPLSCGSVSLFYVRHTGYALPVGVLSGAALQQQRRVGKSIKERLGKASWARSTLREGGELKLVNVIPALDGMVNVRVAAGYVDNVHFFLRYNWHAALHIDDRLIYNCSVSRDRAKIVRLSLYLFLSLSLFLSLYSPRSSFFSLFSSLAPTKSLTHR